MESNTSLDLSGDISAALKSSRENCCASPARRQLLRGVGALAGALLLPAYAEANVAQATDFGRIRTLKLRRRATGEASYFVYWRDGQLDRDGYRYANYLLRDTQAGRSTQMAPALLDVMAWVQAYFRAYGYDEVIVINSGYRTAQTNDRTEGAAKKSLHLRGLAVDMAIPRIPTAYLGELLRRLSQGGVGTYLADGFVHLDVGRVRSWRG